jgi:hypothetical protein
MTSPLESLAGTGKPLAAEPMDAAEFAGLLRSDRARLIDARNASLALESRFDLAYNAAHALCLAALRRHGYRARHRYIVFQALPHTLGLGPEVWRVLDKCHHMRNVAEYEAFSMWTSASWPIWLRRAGGLRMNLPKPNQVRFTS